MRRGVSTDPIRPRVMFRFHCHNRYPSVAIDLLSWLQESSNFVPLLFGTFVAFFALFVFVDALQMVSFFFLLLNFRLYIAIGAIV